MRYLTKQIEKNVTLSGDYAVGYRPDGSIVEATHLWRDEALRAQRPQRAHDRLDGLTLSLVSIWGHNYFHWLTECLTQLLCLDFDEISHIFVPHWYPPFTHESLEYLGLTDKVENWIGIPTQVDLVSFGPQRTLGISYKPGLRKLRNTFSQKATGPEYIYISRADAKKRRVLNEGSFLMANPEYESIVLSDLTLMEQISFFGNAKKIVGPHGAGMANMIWVKKRANIVEMFGLERNPCFQKLSASLGHGYVSVSCRPLGDDMFAELPNG
jgi:capsular polysaccharide biosynthesis protein